MKILKYFRFLYSLGARVLLAPIFCSQITFANPAENSIKVSSDLQTHIYYWAFNGKTSKDPAVQKELVETAAELSDSLGFGDFLDIKALMEKDVQAQGGPQVLLSAKVASLLEMGINKGQYASVNRFLSALGRANPQLAEVSSAFVDYNRNQNVNLRADLFVAPESRAKCLQSCVADFLGLNNNQTFKSMLGNQKSTPSDNRQAQFEREQIKRYFPNDRELNTISTKGSDRSRVAFGSDQKNHCVSVCFKEIASEIKGWIPVLSGVFGAVGGGAGAVAGGLAGLGVGSGIGVAAGVVGALGVGGAVGLGICMNGPECSRTAEREHQVKVKEIELQEREQRLRENEIRIKEEQQQQERHRKAAEEAAGKAKAEAAKRQSEADAQRKRSEEETKRKREDIDKGDWYDREKNKEAKNDSSASCEATKTCDGTMNATVIPEHMQDKAKPEPLTDGHGNLLKDLDLKSTPIPKDLLDIKKAFEPKKIVLDNRPLDWAPNEVKIHRDGTGKIITNFDMTSTPMPGRN